MYEIALALPWIIGGLGVYVVFFLLPLWLLRK